MRNFKWVVSFGHYFFLFVVVAVVLNHSFRQEDLMTSTDHFKSVEEYKVV